MIVCRDVVFVEKLYNTVPPPTLMDVTVPTSNVDATNNDCIEDVPEDGNDDYTGDSDTEHSTASSSAALEERSIAVDRPRRQVRKPNRYADSNMLAFLTAQEINDHGEQVPPQSIGDVMKTYDKESWMDAMIEEMDSIEQNEVYEVTALPQGRKTIKCKWVYDLKRDSESKLVMYKARLAAKGFTQSQGVDYQEVFSPVARFETLRFFLGFVASNDLELEQVDIKTVFLNGKLQEEIYMDLSELPESLRDAYSAAWRGKVWKRKRALYRLKQASKTWYEELKKSLEECGFEQADRDVCFFVYKDANGTYAFILVYVDDAVIAGKTLDSCERIKKMLSEHFEIRDMKAASFFFGIKIAKEQGQ